MSLPQIVIIGHVGYDVVLIDGFERSRHIAGAAFYSAVGAASLISRVGVVSRLPRNEITIIEALKTLKVDLGGITLVSDGKTPEFILRYTGSDFEDMDATRGVTISLGCAEFLAPEDIPPSFLDCSFVHIATANPTNQIQWIKYLRAKSRSIQTISMDTDQLFLRSDPSLVLKAFMLSDIAFINHREEKVLNLLRALKKHVIVKRGGEGAELWFGRELITRVPAKGVRVVDTTGSGDILAGAFMAQIAGGSDYVQALATAVNIASESVREYGVNHLFKNSISQ